jgi:multidrug efflux pump subunit AcrA (membrane-fusion protein)
VDIPEHYRGDEDIENPYGPPVTLTATFAGKNVSWNGSVVRAQGAVDTMSFQLFVVAQIRDPYAKREEGVPPLKMGTFVNATITGRTLENVFVVPSSAVIENREALVVGPGGVLEGREIHILWKEAGEEATDNVVIDQGLNEGDVLCLTPLGFGAVGIKVEADIEGAGRPENENAPSDDQPSKRNE